MANSDPNMHNFTNFMKSSILTIPWLFWSMLLIWFSSICLTCWILGDRFIDLLELMYLIRLIDLTGLIVWIELLDLID